MRGNIKDFIPEGMEVGDEVHVYHCTEGNQNDRLYIRRTERGYLYDCKHCGWAGGIGEDKPGYSRAKKEIRLHARGGSVNSEYTKVNEREPRLPKDSVGRVRDWSSKARVWVYKAGLNDKELSTYGFVYSEWYDRVWYPVYNDGDIKAVIGRRLKDDNTPKYLIYKAKGFNDLWYSNPVKSDVVCIVEDVLSGIRVARHVAGAALLGTNFSDSAINELTNKHKRFIIFMDDDKPEVKMKQVKLKS